MGLLFTHKQQRSLLKLISLFSLVRGHNIIVLIIAQYLTARFILAPQLSWWTLLFDIKFFSIVLASSLTTAAGYIINNFYDAPKDKINRPKKYILEHLVSQQIQLALFLILNMTAFIFASIVSFRAVLFFLLYMFAIWIYSFRVKRLFWLSNLYSALLMILPFWAITLYFKNFDILVFYHAGYLFFLILARDIIKDLENLKGDWVHRYKTLPIVFDNKSTKWITTLCLLGCLIPNFYLIRYPLGLMHFYFGISPLYLILVLVFLWRANDQKTYLWLHNLIKAWILIGVLSIGLIHKAF